MATHEATVDVREEAMKESTTDKLEEVTSPLSPHIETQDGPDCRADVGQGRWTPPPAPWKVNDGVFLRLRDGRTAGPFNVVDCHPPRNPAEDWRFDIRDASGNKRDNIRGSIMF
ncbi:hypothetical protein GQ44DRAFT_718971 [Phaeosphaeriaceae sp. PMI808]|nr:hypothetical protein GQ44DRAFT_718971 [Phaeosphaeriaceae sp. PMI808]